MGAGVPSRNGEAAFAASNGNLAAAGDTVWMLSGGGASRVYRSVDRGRTGPPLTPRSARWTDDGRLLDGLRRCPPRHPVGRNWEAKDDNTARAAVTADGAKRGPSSPTVRAPATARGPPGGSGGQQQPGGTPGGIDVSDDGHVAPRGDSAFYAARFQPFGRNPAQLYSNERIGRISARALGTVIRSRRLAGHKAGELPPAPGGRGPRQDRLPRSPQQPPRVPAKSASSMAVVNSMSNTLGPPELGAQLHGPNPSRIGVPPSLNPASLHGDGNRRAGRQPSAGSTGPRHRTPPPEPNRGHRPLPPRWSPLASPP